MRHVYASMIALALLNMPAFASPLYTGSPYMTQQQKNRLGSHGVPPPRSNQSVYGDPIWKRKQGSKIHACTKQVLQCRGPKREAFTCYVAEGNDDCTSTCFDEGHACMMKKTSIKH